jgi:hypothetical protein
MRHLRIILLIFILIMSFPVIGFSSGKFTLKPGITTSWESDSNFFRADAAEREVYTYLFQPGFNLGYVTAKSKITFDYSLNSYTYRDSDTLSAGEKDAGHEDYTGHTASLDMKTNSSPRIGLGFSNSYSLTRDPANSDTLNNSIERNKFYIYRATPSVTYDFGNKFSAGLKYRNTLTDYSESRNERSTEHRGILDIVYNLNKSTSLDLEMQHWVRWYDTSTDYSSNQGRLIFRKDLNRISLAAGAGYQKRTFDDGAMKDISTPSFLATVTYQDSASKEDSRTYVNFGAESNFNDAGSGNTYYTGTRFNLNAGHVFYEMFPLDIKATYQNSDYETQTGLTDSGNLELREDDSTSYEGSFGYIISEYITVKALSGYEGRESNIAGRDYDNRYIMIKLEFNYSLGKR